ncbi:MAG TPA: endo-1,4-beta-xylanase [Candidatus Binatia bacterium]|jgi:endo-1,4-beta-xylanase
MVAATLAVALACHARAFAAAPPPEGCEASKLNGAAGAALRTVKCHATAARFGLPVDATCLDAADRKVDVAFRHAEARPCVSHDDAPAIAATLTALAAEVAASVGGGPSRCDQRMLLAAGKHLQATLKAQSVHAAAPESQKLATLLAKRDAKFAARAASAESAADCTHAGNAPAVAALLDARSSDVVDAVRGTLRGVAARTGRRIGAAVRANVLASDEAAYRDVIVRQFDALTAEYEFMWGNMEPTRGTYVLGPIDTIVAFAQQHALPLKGAPLVWHLILPPWVNDGMTATELQTAVDERIDGLVSAYAGTVATWDVVNEAVVDSGAAFRDSIFLQKLGPDYIRNAFVRARQADPAALLFYNDFLADGVNAKSDFIYGMIVDLLAQGTPIDGMSFQMHLGGGFGAPPTRESVRQNLQRFADLGLVVRISEMDVQRTGTVSSAADRLAQQRIVYHDMVAACRDVAACDSVTFWGVSDAHTWVKDYLGVMDAPLPYDEQYQPKAAFFGIRDALLGF